MNLTVITDGDKTLLEGPAGAPLLTSADQIVDVIGACFEQGTRAILLYAENLTPGFFDLSSGEAGAILQKIRNYHMRLAVVTPAGGAHQSTRFGDMLVEESRVGDFRIFEDREAARAWLLG